MTDWRYRCQQTSSGSAPNVVSGTAVSTSGRVEWQVVAHEIGHNFGAIVSFIILHFSRAIANSIQSSMM